RDAVAEKDEAKKDRRCAGQAMRCQAKLLEKSAPGAGAHHLKFAPGQPQPTGIALNTFAGAGALQRNIFVGFGLRARPVARSASADASRYSASARTKEGPHVEPDCASLGRARCRCRTPDPAAPSRWFEYAAAADEWSGTQHQPRLRSKWEPASAGAEDGTR